MTTPAAILALQRLRVFDVSDPDDARTLLGDCGWSRQGRHLSACREGVEKRGKARQGGLARGWKIWFSGGLVLLHSNQAFLGFDRVGGVSAQESFGQKENARGSQWLNIFPFYQ